MCNTLVLRVFQTSYFKKRETIASETEEIVRELERVLARPEVQQDDLLQKTMVQRLLNEPRFTHKVPEVNFVYRREATSTDNFVCLS